MEYQEGVEESAEVWSAVPPVARCSKSTCLGKLTLFGWRPTARQSKPSICKAGILTGCHCVLRACPCDLFAHADVRVGRSLTQRARCSIAHLTSRDARIDYLGLRAAQGNRW